MGDQKTEVYFVFMNFDPKYERLHADRSKEGVEELDTYLSKKHDRLLEKLFQPNTYKKKSSLAIVDGFSVEITKEQAATLRSAKEVRVVEKNQELA
ncbi:uncharacterized protein LOC135678790 isoform X2 [Musa acuminata AAA Group]|uniref:Inhibitor I9 domain-containing protein n=2 Tax=Musa TaxID=4640 RepID=A0A804JVL6_MUSAM|nr:PREDICTED: uncharacterized protein LOC103991638 isoform X2 [Musa acuminata subsp. malaccensis]THU60661.1 hypothetical protein C4D60_Mb07t15140 [Musa balbisiana]